MIFVVDAHVNDAITPSCCEVNQGALDGNSSNEHDDVRQNVKIGEWRRRGEAGRRGGGNAPQRAGGFRLKWRRSGFSLSPNRMLLGPTCAA